jgi:hypothetical protein
MRWRGMMLATLLAFVGSCGAEPTQDTCFALDIHYSGSRTGTAYARLQGNNGVWGVFSSDSAPSMQIVMLHYSSGMFCGSRKVNGGDLPFTADAWIDVTGSEAASCVDVLSASCRPAAGDPQGHAQGVMPFGKTTIVRLDVVDPPP